MSSLWNLVLDSSTLPDAPENDLWDHLNNLGAGTGPGGTLTLLDGLEVEIAMTCYEVEIDLDEYEVEVDTVEFEVEIDNNEVEIEVC